MEVRHFDGYSALADLIKNPEADRHRPGGPRAGAGQERARAGSSGTSSARIRLSTVFLSPARAAADRAAPEADLRLGAAGEAVPPGRGGPARPGQGGHPRAAEAACKECLTLPLASKVLAIASLHLLRELTSELLEPSATRLLASQDDPYVTLNALEAISAGPPSSSGELAKALLTALLPRRVSREVRDAAGRRYLGEKVTVDITESLKEPALTGDDARRAAALAILDRRISAGLVANRDGTVEFLYRILRGDHEPSRRSAALMLWKMGDDYAPEVLRDFLSAGSDEAIVDILRAAPGSAPRALSCRARAPASAGERRVQAALRDLAPADRGAGVHEKRALEMALRRAGRRVPTEDEDLPLLDESAPAVELRTERSTFQFERENMQELVMFFSDIQGYSKKAQVLTPMQLSALLQEYEKILLAHVEAHRGELVKRMGDGHMIVFQRAAGRRACRHPPAEIPAPLQPLPRREHPGGDPHRDP